jgi:hypothetical protein
MSTKTVIPIDAGNRFRDSYRVTSPDIQTNVSHGIGIWTKKQPESVRHTGISWEQLYPSEEITDPLIVAAQRMLGEIIRRLEAAFQEIDRDPITADDHVQSAHPILAELFCCRSVGEGFAAIINAALISLLNQRGEPLSKKQIGVLTRSLKELKSHLFLSYDSSLRVLRELKKHGLRIHPEALQHLDLQHE